MIRDPSDGSVKDLDNDHGAKSPVTTGDPKAPMPHESGLPAESQKSSYQERLSRSRKWLADYKSNPENLVRTMGDTDVYGADLAKEYLDQGTTEDAALSERSPRQRS